ncbi:unnamed protein product, partial [Brassica oleracea]
TFDYKKRENDCLQSSSDLVHQLEEEELAQQSIFFHCLEEQTQKVTVAEVVV